MANRSHASVSDVFQAPVMATIATATPYTTRQDIEIRHGMGPTRVVETIRHLVGRGWVTQYASHRPHSGRPPKVPVPTDLFWEDYQAAVETANALGPADRWLRKDATEQLRSSWQLPESGRPYLQAYSLYLGKTALLAERHNLSELADWFSGLAGWRALVTIEAHKA